MKYFALIYYVVGDFVARRAPFRAEHLQLAQAAKQRGLQLPLSWQKLPFDNEAQRAEWELWATISMAKKKAFPIARTKPAKQHAAKKGK